jgi:hypothetical protein
MADAIGSLIRFVLTNYALTFLVLALAGGAWGYLRAPRPASTALAVDKFLHGYVFFAVGAYFAYNFVMHGIFGEATARVIGWDHSPFQFEVATASLGFGVVGFIAARRGFEMRLAAILGPAIFQLGAAAGHIYQMITARNFAPGNAGIIFYMDILIPAFGFWLLWLDRRCARAR